MTQEITFEVLGEPRPAGSKKAFPYRKTDGALGVHVTHACAKTKSYMQEVAWAAKAAMEGKLTFTGAVELEIVFFRPRPKGHFGKKGLNRNGRETPFPATRPDTIKLARAVEDALTGIVWVDDSQVVTHLLRKRWSQYGYQTQVCVRELTDEPF